MSDLGRIVVSYERRLITDVLRFVRLLKYHWAQRLSHREASRKVIKMDGATGTITVDKPFPKWVKEGMHIIHRLED